ncbi:MAG: hypothetical protein CSA34_01160 [Desulfobulbus propionicus]|nr:MAG: hypothetical protein CSA34_01160 [Desulfobulbus propionicus]
MDSPIPLFNTIMKKLLPGVMDLRFKNPTGYTHQPRTPSYAALASAPEKILKNGRQMMAHNLHKHGQGSIAPFFPPRSEAPMDLFTAFDIAAPVPKAQRHRSWTSFIPEVNETSMR